VVDEAVLESECAQAVQSLERRAADCRERQVVVLEVDDGTVERVRGVRATRTAGSAVAPLVSNVLERSDRSAGRKSSAASAPILDAIA
jgi:hypothetical protein